MKVLCVLLALLMVSCSMEIGVNEEISPYIKITPFEGYYAQVDIYDADAEVPELAKIDGKWYAVTVINSCVAPDGFEKQTVLNIKDGIMVINSNAYAKYEDVVTVNLPSSMQSLGKNSLPPNTAELVTPSMPCQDLKIALEDPDSLRKITITDMGFADLSALTSLEEVTVVDGVWPYFPNLPDKVEEKLFFQGFFQDGVYCEAGKVGKGTAVPVWAENPREHEQPAFVGGASFRLFIYFTTEECFRIKPVNDTENEYENESDGSWRFKIDTDNGYSYKWYVNNQIVADEGDYTITELDTGELIFVYRNVPVGLSQTVRCAFFDENEELKAVTQLTFTRPANNGQ